MRRPILLAVLLLSSCGDPPSDPCGAILQPTGRYAEIHFAPAIIVMSSTLERDCKRLNNGSNEYGCADLSARPHMVYMPPYHERMSETELVQEACTFNHEYIGHHLNNWPANHPKG